MFTKLKNKRPFRILEKLKTVTATDFFIHKSDFIAAIKECGIYQLKSLLIWFYPLMKNVDENLRASTVSAISSWAMRAAAKLNSKNLAKFILSNCRTLDEKIFKGPLTKSEILPFYMTFIKKENF